MPLRRLLVPPALLVAACWLWGCATAPAAPLAPTAAPAVTAAAPASASAAFAPDSPQPEPASPVVAPADDDIEEMVVTERRLLDVQGRRGIYRQVAKGKRLFAQNQYKEAFPYLLTTAERGFKDSQARVGHIYLAGLGDVDRDAEAGVGWLGVAATGTTSPGIRNYFNDIWERIPEQHVPYFEEVVDEYRTRYGEETTGVVCEMHRPLRSFVKELGCFFEAALPDEIVRTLHDMEDHEAAIELAMERLRQIQEAMSEDRSDRATTGAPD